MESESRTGTPKIVWIGRVFSILISLLFLMSAAMKLKGGPELAQGLAHMGLPESMVLPLAILELSCVILYLIPATSVLGAILLTGMLWPRDARASLIFIGYFIGMSLSYTIFSEWLNVVVWKNWAYSAMMPVVPPLMTSFRR